MDSHRRVLPSQTYPFLTDGWDEKGERAGSDALYSSWRIYCDPCETQEKLEIGVMVDNHYSLDLSGLLCPMPVIRVQDRVTKLFTGDRLKVICTDPGVLQDIPAWCRINGHEVLSVMEEKYRIIIELKIGGHRYATE